MNVQIVQRSINGEKPLSAGLLLRPGDSLEVNDQEGQLEGAPAKVVLRRNQDGDLTVYVWTEEPLQ